MLQIPLNNTFDFPLQLILHECLYRTYIRILRLPKLIQLVYLILPLFLNTHLWIIRYLVTHPLNLHHSRTHFLLNLKCHQLKLIEPFSKVRLV